MPITTMEPLIFAEIASEPDRMDVFVGQKGRGVVRIGQYDINGKLHRFGGLQEQLRRLDFDYDQEGRVVVR